MTTQADKLLTVAQVASALHLSTRAVQHRIAKGQIAAIKIGTGRTSAYVIEPREVERIKNQDSAA